MDILLDTNLLARCIQPGHPLHVTAISAMKELSRRNEKLFIVPQVLYEHFVICARPPGEYGGLGMINEAAIAELGRVEKLAEMLPDVPAIYPEWRKLMALHKIIGKRAHDARLAAAMNVHGLRAIATFNSRDFRGFSDVQIIAPEELAIAWSSRAS